VKNTARFNHWGPSLRWGDEEGYRDAPFADPAATPAAGASARGA
jgi:hypothetical protein